MKTPLSLAAGASPWTRRYAIAADARLMDRPNTSLPRSEATAPAPTKPVGAATPG